MRAVCKTLTSGQKRYLGALQNERNSIVIATGPAGSGKTSVACDYAKESTFRRIIITKPAVSVDEEHGFLPGTLEKKMEPWILSVKDQMGGSRAKLEVAPLSHMRGRTFEDCLIIADECQNATPNQMKMLLTRIGQGSKMIVTGDVDQTDLTLTPSGLTDFLNKLPQMTKHIEHVQLDNSDIRRHPAVREVLNIYNK